MNRSRPAYPTTREATELWLRRAKEEELDDETARQFALSGPKIMRFTARADGLAPNAAGVDAMVAAADRAGGGPRSVPRGDPIYRLPTPAADKLRRLRAHNQDLTAALRDLGERKNQAIMDRTVAANRIAQLRQELPNLPGMGATDTHPSMQQAISRKEIADRQLAEIDQRESALQGRTWGSLRALERYVAECPDPLEAHAETVEPPKRLTLADARHKVDEIKADLHTVESAAVPSMAVKGLIRAQVEALAERGTPDLGPCIEQGAPLAWPVVQVQAQLMAFAALPDAPAVNGFSSHAAPDVLALFAWLHKDALITALETEVDLISDDDNALTDEERASRVSALRAQLLQAERFEETLISASEKQGIPVLRRNDADPRAVLQLSGALPAPR